MSRREIAYALDDVIITPELARRPSRRPQHAAEKRALVDLAQAMADAPETLARRLVEAALKLCRAGSAGLSLLETGTDGEVFRWAALAGEYAPHVGGTTPRDFSPCGACLDRGSAQLYSYPARYFTYLHDVEPPIVEG